MLVKEQLKKLKYQTLIIDKGDRGYYQYEPPYDLPNEILNESMYGYQIDKKVAVFKIKGTEV